MESNIEQLNSSSDDLVQNATSCVKSEEMLKKSVSFRTSATKVKKNGLVALDADINNQEELVKRLLLDALTDIFVKDLCKTFRILLQQQERLGNIR